MCLVLVTCLWETCLETVARITDHPFITLAVDSGCIALINHSKLGSFTVLSLQTTECLCMLGCDVDAVSDTKHTPLQVMLMKDRMECVYELFCYGADCNIGDSNGDTPLHWAVQV